MIPHYQYLSETPRKEVDWVALQRAKRGRIQRAKSLGVPGFCTECRALQKKNRKLAHLYKHHDFLASPPSVAIVIVSMDSSIHFRIR